MKKIYFLLFSFISFSSCQNEQKNSSVQKNDSSLQNQTIVSSPKKDSPPAKDTIRKIVQDDSVRLNPVGATELFYRPYVSVLKGKLKLEKIYGPPGFGDDPTKDAVEHIYMLYLDKAITAIYTPLNTLEDDTQDSITKIQFDYGEDSVFKKLVGKKITVKGTLRGPCMPLDRAAVMLEDPILVK